MNDDIRQRRDVASFFAETAPSRGPDALLHDVFLTTGRMRPRPRWLALIKEPPMRLSSRPVVGSPTARLATIAIATILLAAIATGAAMAGAAYVAGPSVIVVAQDGTGTATTITEAVAMAKDGDTIRLMPGTYAETVVIDKDLTVEGDPDSARDEIVVTFTLDSPEVVGLSAGGLPNAITLAGADAALRHLTFEGPQHGVAVYVTGGDVLIEDLAVALPGEFDGLGRYAVNVGDGATGTLRDIACNCAVAITQGSALTVERLTQTQDVLIINGPGSDPLVRESALNSVWIQEGAHPSLIGNTISKEVLIEAATVADPPTVAELRDNVIDGQDSDVPYGVQTVQADALFVGNIVRGQVTGFDIGIGDTPTIEGNTFEDNTLGINVQGPSSGVPEVLDGIQGNSFCGNITDLAAPAGATVTMAGNEVCDAEPSSAP